MIDPKELSLGNYVTTTLSSTPQKVTSLKQQGAKDGIFYTIGVENISRTVLKEHVFPIRLTEEILYKCNFKYSPHHVCYVNNGFLIEKIGDVLCERRYGIPITSLHELQNLFFIITGRELGINI